MEVLKDNNLKIPLYHGTSSLFLSSISDFGLGARNPVQSLRILPFLKRIYKICEHLFGEDSLWQVDKLIVEKVINQEITGGNFNFSHGNTYLTPSRLTAVRYAMNSLGSEALSIVANFYKKIKEHSPKFLNFKPKEYPVIKILDQEKGSYPILVEALNVNIKDLKSEIGKDARKVFEHLELLLENGNGDLEILSQQNNFKLINPLPFNQLKIYKIIFLEDKNKIDPIFPKYNLQEIYSNR